ncbi:peptidyl-prolyl cis-trans isomerase FKBP53 [Triticum urartu]|uniref:FK506-binding protein n=2 Tax=Triticum urartu TaxID=4572 RepID=A0A8R7TJF8_TRIUA|nr:peptidyl-prolyl cis-trans isomerase FKBP53 [Triticum urartu]
MSSFWGAEVKPEKPYTHAHSPRRGRLRLTQATLGAEVGKVEKGKTDLVQLQCTVKNKEPVYLCALIPGQSVTCHLDLEFEEKFVTFSVLGSRSVHLAGYYVGDVYEDIGDSDTGSESLQGSDDDFMASDDDDVVIPVSHGQMNTDSEDDSDYDEDYDSEDDEDLIYNQGRGKSSVVIEEIQEDEKPVDDNSRLQLAVRTPPAESVESEDEDGFPVSESKKSSKGSSKKAKNLNNGTSTEDRKRKSDAINDPHKSSGEVNAENDVVSKKKKKDKDKRNAVNSEKVNDEEKEVKLASSADTVAAKQKKKKSKKQSTSEGDTDKQADKKTITDNDEEPSKQGAKKKKNKKKTKENNGSENQAATDVMNSASKEQTSPKARTYGNGLIVQTVALGKPDGKKATPGKKVFVTYTGKLKNGKIFDSNVGRKPFAFRLGIGQVIKGWDIGVNGMRIGDKRKLTIPPSMGYGNQKAGEIPPNSTLLFDVELMNVH